MWRTTDVMVNLTRFDGDLWFQHLEFIFVFLGTPKKKVTFPHNIFVSSDVVNLLTDR